jgi:glucoamylase
MIEDGPEAPGRPGIPPRWTSSAKCGVGTALSDSSRLWFTLSHGIINEIYYPRVDQACTRDLGLIVTDGHDYFSEEKRDARFQVAYLSEGVPAYRLTNTCNQGRYRIEKEILTDPRRDVLLQRTRFVALQGKLSAFHLFALLAPHLGNRGSGNTAWVGDYKGIPMLFAERDALSLALACSVPWKARSAGYVGFSDGWQDLHRNKQLTWAWGGVQDGNVALVGEVDLQAASGCFVLALGFARKANEAAQRALLSLADGFDAALTSYVSNWREWQSSLLPMEREESSKRDLYRISTAVLQTHESKGSSGGFIASLSIPWGMAKSDEDLGGYHLVWPRDLVETASALLASGAKTAAHRVLSYLRVTQEADGHWAQNMWLDGTPFWAGVQMDETALPILLVDLARREGALDSNGIVELWPMVRKAAGFLVRNGPVTQQDRWEEDAGYSPFTLATEIAALLGAADLAELNREPGIASYLRETADAWNACIERWIYVTGTELARRCGVAGYYVRVAPPERAELASPLQGFVPIKNRPPDQSAAPAEQIVSPDALALVRFGLRAADDPRILNTVRVIDDLLKIETPGGPAWHRYNGDGYGERENGEPFDGTGVGRAWPLLTGERAHYALAAGNRSEAKRLLSALESFASEGGMIPEQVWDAPDLPDRELFLGHPSGSAMPLVWAHAEYIKLRRSLRDGRVFDMPPQPLERYVVAKAGSLYAPWRFNQKCREVPKGRILRIELLAPARIHWSMDGWSSTLDTETRDTKLGVYVGDLPTGSLASGTTISFTFYWSEGERWEGTDFSVSVS